MRYIERNVNGNIVGSFSNNQNGRYTERLNDNDPELLAFNNRALSANTQFLNTSQIFCQTGYTIFTIPHNATNIIKVKLWGAGGGSSATNSLGQSNYGFSGTYVTCDIDISSFVNRNLIIHVGGKGRKSIANSFGYSDGAGGGGYSSISTFEGQLVASAAGGNGGKGVSYDANNDNISTKLNNADNGGINGGTHGGLGEMGAGGEGGLGGGTTFSDEIITSTVDIINGIDDKAPNTDDLYYIPGVNISQGGVTPTQTLINGIDGGNGLVVIIW